MDILAALNRIERWIAEQKAAGNDISIASLSRMATGSNDTVRNWLRARDAGRKVGATLETVKKVAAAMGVSSDWLVSSEDGLDPAPTPPAPGFHEEATPYEPPPQSQSPSQSSTPGSTAVTWPGRHPSITHRASMALPDFGIMPGDLIVCDLSRDPDPGEVVVVTVVDQQLARSVTIIRRFAPPHLIGGSGAARADILTIDQPDLGHLHPMIGLIRGA